MKTGIAALCAIVLMCGCGKDRSPLSPTQPGVTTPGTPGAAYVVSLAIVGPAALAPGATEPFKAIGTMSDGTTADVTTKVGWTGFPKVITVAPTGAVTGVSVGEGTIRAQMPASVRQGVFTNATVLVLEPNTYKLSGRVLEDGYPVMGAQVAVTGGIGAGQTATTDYYGEYRLYGVAGDIDVRVTKASYRTETHRLTVGGSSAVDLPLSPEYPEPDLSGVYDLTFTADAFCSIATVALPVDMRVRKYVATITQAGPAITVDLSGATFRTQNGRGGSFTGHVEPKGIVIEIRDWNWDDVVWPDLIERVDDTRQLMIGGFGTLELRGRDIVGTMYADWLLSLQSGNGSSLGGCTAGYHPVSFVRR